MQPIAPTPSNLQIDDFAFDLPEDLIAQKPPEVRHASRLMCVERGSGQFSDRLFAQLPELLRGGDLLVVNDTRVIPARLLARRASGGAVEILLLRPEPTRPGVWLAMATPLRKLKVGEELYLDNHHNQGSQDVLAVDSFAVGEDGHKRLLLDFGSQANVHRILSQTGLAPLPPYIKRPSASADAGQNLDDLERYQTIFAQAPGAVAAPTAGLHFSHEIFAQLAERGVQTVHITLHVGPGTFKPISSSLEEHSIESERFSISEEAALTINTALDRGQRLIAVGTTSCRALETAGASGRIQPVQDAQTALYIKPGFQFKIVSGLITNFHLSRSSLLVLVASFAGHQTIMRAYKHAVDQRYRFFSYGDAMLIT